jgi:hypothetical protein
VIDIRTIGSGSRLRRLMATSRLLVVAAVLALVIVARLPLTGATVLDSAARLHTRQQPAGQMLHVFSAVQGRPTETCSTFGTPPDHGGRVERRRDRRHWCRGNSQNF